ncbi:MAG: D-alanyl-D-alanine carboxypeptidase [Alphaproteobacteria bacterium]
MGAIVACVVWAMPAWAQRAAVVVDASDGSILYGRNVTAPAHPASLTKMMTLYLAFEAIEAGRLSLAETLTASARAAGQGGATLDLDPGQKITTADALRAVITRSANDAAVVLAERLGGSESAFGAMMTAKAKALGMTRTSFVNATGMTAPGHLTTARDMALLALALRRDFPRHYALFAARGVTWGGRSLPTVNGFLVSFKGADGIKTGFTCAAGYNLVASASRNGRRLVGVVLGARNKDERRNAMHRLLETAFSGRKEAGLGNVRTLDEGKGGAAPDLRGEACGGRGASVLNASIALPGAPPGKKPGKTAGRQEPPRVEGWALDVGISRKEAEARRMAAQALARLRRDLGGGRAATVLKAGDGVVAYRALIIDVNEQPTVATCLAMRARDEDCLVLTPPMLAGAIEDAERYIRFFAE